MSAPTRPGSVHDDAAPAAPGERFPLGPLTSAELAVAVPDRRARDRYPRIWHGMYRREDQPDDLLMRSLALARTWPRGVLRGRSAAVLWGDDSAPADAPPEIWLPATRRSVPGRVYRYGAMAEASVTERDGVRVTTRLRTCRDLAADLPHEDAVVAIDRLCARDHSLIGLLGAAVAHPSHGLRPAGGRGRAATGQGRTAAEQGRTAGSGSGLARVVADLDPRAGSAEASRARVLLAAAPEAGRGSGGSESAARGRFGHGHEIRIGRRVLRPDLADPAGRCVVEFRRGPRSVDERARDERVWAALRRAGWSVLVVVTPDRPPHPAAGPAGTDPGPGGTAERALEVLRGRWPSAELLRPLDRPAAATDPHGMWAGISPR